MERNNVIEQIRELVVEQLDADTDKVTEATSFVDDLGADSLDIVELVMAFEDEFETTIPEEQIEQIRTVGAAADFVLAQVAK